MQTTAQIIPLKTAAVSPVIQSRWRGRYPKGVTSMRVYLRMRFFASLEAEDRAKEIEHRLSNIAVCEKHLSDQRRQLAELSQSSAPGRV